ncbi:hypothetical protein BDD12DRAFT_806594 [Trichophaea hybrida]|nr:hypothetical protein BDD12DRAFT_806594 [Trichophaea hybrida]
MCPPHHPPMSPQFFPPLSPGRNINARRSMDSEKIYSLHIIKDADTSSPSIHTFPIDSDSLPTTISLQHLRTLTSSQLRIISSHLSSLNSALPEKTPPCDPGEAQESDFETPWALEGIEIEVVPDTLFVNALFGARRPGRGGEKREVFGVKTWKPKEGVVQKEIVAVFSRLVCCRAYRRGFQGSVSYARPHGRGPQLHEEVWKVDGEVGRETVLERRGAGYRSDSEDEILV